MEKKIIKKGKQHEENSNIDSLCKSNMFYPTWEVIKELLDDDEFNDPQKSFGKKPIEKGNAPICSKIKGDIITNHEEQTPCGIDIPVLLKPESETKQPLIVILGESALRNQKELADITNDASNNVILGTPYAIHLKECPPKCGVYRKIFDAILEKGYPIYLTDIIKIWWEGKKDCLLVPNDLDIDVFKEELNILKKERNNNIIIVAWGETAQNGLEKVRKDSKDVLPSLSLPHPGQRNWNAWKLRIFEKAVFSKNPEYATRLYGEDPNGDKNKTTAEKVAGEAVQSIDDYINSITKLINNNLHVTYKQIAETLNTSEEEALGIFKWWQKEGIIK